MTAARQTLGEAWRGIGPRGWLLAAAAGGLLGLAQALNDLVRRWDLLSGASMIADAYVVTGIRWALLLVPMGLALRLATAWTDALRCRRPLRWPDHAAAVVGVIGFALLVVDPLVLQWLRSAPALLEVAYLGPTWIVPADTPWWDGLVQEWGFALPMILVVAILWPVVHGSLRQADADERRLAAAQLRLAESRRRMLAAELSGAQAMVEPTFLFGTLSDAERCFESDPARSGALLDALIRYLRAAMPAHPEAESTLGEQSELLRAWLEVESLRRPGRLRTRLDVDAGLATRRFAPLLLVPLLAEAVERRLGAGDAGEIGVRVSGEGGRIVVAVEVRADRAGAALAPVPPPSELAARVAALYGADAQVAFEPVGRDVLRARLDIADPGGA